MSPHQAASDRDAKSLPRGFLTGRAATGRRCLPASPPPRSAGAPGAAVRRPDRPQGLRQLGGRHPSVEAVHRPSSRRGRGQRRGHIVQVAGSEGTRNHDVVGDIAERAVQEGLVVHKPAACVDGADAVLVQRPEQGQQPAERFGLAEQPVGVEEHRQVAVPGSDAPASRPRSPSRPSRDRLCRVASPTPRGAGADVPRTAGRPAGERRRGRRIVAKDAAAGG